MKIKKIHSILKTAAVALLFIVPSAAQAQINYVSSSLSRFQAYAEPLYNGSGGKIGIKVHYSLGSLLDASNRPSHYSAVCLKEGTLWGSPCIDRSSGIRVWTRTGGFIGAWLTRNITMNCSSSANAVVHVHQPYISPPNSVLNFSRNGSPPYSGSQLFYSGSSDTAVLQINGCQQI